MGNYNAAEAKLTNGHPSLLTIDRGDGYVFVFDKQNGTLTTSYNQSRRCGPSTCCPMVDEKHPALLGGEVVTQLSCKLSEISKIHVKLHSSTNDLPFSSSCWYVYLEVNDSSEGRKEIRLTSNKKTNFHHSWSSPFTLTLEKFLGVETDHEMNVSGSRVKENMRKQENENDIPLFPDPEQQEQVEFGWFSL